MTATEPPGKDYVFSIESEYRVLNSTSSRRFRTTMRLERLSQWVAYVPAGKDAKIDVLGGRRQMVEVAGV